MKLQRIPPDNDKLLEERIRDETDKAPISIQFVLPHRKADSINRMIDSWQKENPEKGKGD